MTHLGERITDFIFNELSADEMREAKRHVAECADCLHEVERFQLTHAMLRTSHDVEPPRRIVFEVEKPKRLFDWRWAAPLSAAAALILVVFLAAPIQVRWNASQLTIAFGAQPQPAAVNVTPPPALVDAADAAGTAGAAGQPIDYERIVREVRQGQDAWLAVELGKRDAEHRRDLQRVQGELVYIDSVQRSMLRETMENASSIQLLAQKDE